MTSSGARLRRSFVPGPVTLIYFRVFGLELSTRVNLYNMTSFSLFFPLARLFLIDPFNQIG